MISLKLNPLLLFFLILLILLNFLLRLIESIHLEGNRAEGEVGASLSHEHSDGVKCVQHGALCSGLIAWVTGNHALSTFRRMSYGKLNIIILAAELEALEEINW